MYRVDKRNFKIGDIINVPENSYQDSKNFDNRKQNVENILTEEKTADKNGERKNSLFIFAELSDAIRFTCVMSDSRLYKVTGLADTIFLHKGDMNLTEIMNKLTEQETALRTMARSYWQGEKTFKPCWEILVDKVQVTEVLIGDNEARKRILSDFKMNCQQNIEKLNFYFSNLNQ